ncbi:hypothetical protein [Micromonospora sp. NPDC050276]|uniref:hypothetical protein n=1 Tax=Micromonospora sp. NPDC050276 TaxID=3364278 RepID=UPI00378DC083
MTSVPAATAEWIDTFHQWLTDTVTTRPTSPATASASTGRGPPSTASRASPPVTEARPTSSGARRCSRRPTWWSVSRPRRTPPTM